jgi:hypothetical protein
MNERMQPKEGEFAPFYAGYIARVKNDNLSDLLLSQIEEVLVYFKKQGEELSLKSYGEGKWTQKEVLGHITDTDRIMTFRALCFARGEKSMLPGFDQDHYVATANFNSIPLVDLLQDFEFSRFALVSLLRNLPENSLTNLGNANGFDVSVRALFTIIAGHTDHHLSILKERY